MRRLGALLAGLLALAPPGAGRADPSWQLPPATGAVDYQLGGAYRPDPRISILARDSSGRPEPGLYNICYVNGFQTQPGSLGWWLSHHPEAILRDADGDPVADPDWPDEYALDTRSTASRDSIVKALAPTVRHCAEAGFQAVEFDNLDSWTRFDALAAEGNLRLARSLVAMAHGLGLAVGQKNAPELAGQGPKAGFDFVISESCARWNECASYRAQYGAAHLDIEYQGALPDGLSFRDLCSRSDLPALTVLRDRNLSPAGAPGHVFALCPAG